MRPLNIDKTFHLVIDAFTRTWGGLLLPKICLLELNTKIGNTDLLLSMESSFGEDTHLSKSNFFRISSSEENSREVGVIAMSMMAVFTFESLKMHPQFSVIESQDTVQFLRHLRNAAAHGNQFHFTRGKSQKIIDPKKITWRNKIIDQGLQGKIAFPDFFKYGDFPYLLEDITKLLK